MAEKDAPQSDDDKAMLDQIQDEIKAVVQGLNINRAGASHSRAEPPSAPAPIVITQPGAWPTFPRWSIILIALWLALLETADKLPRLLLALPGYEATRAEFEAKMMQPEMMAAQVQKAKNEARASAFLAETAEVQLDKAKAEAKAAHWQPYLNYTQAELARKQWMDGGPNDAWMADYARHTVKLEPHD